MGDKVVCFGEIMMRLATPGFQRLVQADSFEVTYGGGEANVSVSMANFGAESFFVSCVPDNPLGQSAINHLRRFGVNTDFVNRSGSRLGIYFLETGASQRASTVVYDRAFSAVAEAKPDSYDWDEVFRGASWFHFTGITPALGDKAASAVLNGCKKAKEAGVRVSCDLNYRKKLWSPEKAREVMSELMPYVDVVVANEEDAEKTFGIKSLSSDIGKGELDLAGYREVAQELAGRFNLQSVAITLRESLSASENGWSGLLYDSADSGFSVSERYLIKIVDRVGGGDSFAAGLIYGMLQGWQRQKVIDFAAAASCLKHTIPGDFNMVSVDEVERLCKGDASGRVQR